MSTLQIILIIILVMGGTLVAFRDVKRLLSFNRCYKKAEDMIMNADRDSSIEALRACNAIDILQEKFKARYLVRHIEQLRILWRSKFANNFKI